ncbi:MAG: cyclic nucleotide-binding domain-containing protein [Alphaproteobacteria bacterium]|nr:cyclic nucleotide-binding domain-containing protein [Alphaproteobacteria bacterium]
MSDAAPPPASPAAPQGNDPSQGHGLDASIEQELRTTPLLAGLDRAAQDNLVWRFRAQPFTPGDRLIRAGDHDSDLLLLLEGFAEVFARAGNRRYLVAVLEPGSVMGEISFFDPDRPRTADVVAATSGLAARLPRTVYDELLVDGSPAAESLERAVLHAVSLRMQYTNETLAELLDTHKTGGLLKSLARMFRPPETP